MDNKERAEQIKKYRRSIKELNKTLDAIPKKVWDFKPEPKEWSINEIIVHLLDTEFLSISRARKMVAEPGSVVMAMDQDKFADALGYADMDIKKTLRLLKYTVAYLTDWLKTLPNEAFEISCTHPSYEGAYTVDRWLAHFADHIYVHIQQINNNYTAWKSSR